MATTTYIVPLTAEPQTFEIDLGGVVYALRLYWNWKSEVWLLDILLPSGAGVATGVPLVGNTNLLEQFDYLEVGGALFCQTDANIDAPPTFDNLGAEARLYFSTTAP